MNQISKDIKSFLEEKVIQYNQPDFIEPDPISIPHQFNLKEDIEIAGFLAATIAWGNRKMIVKKHKILNRFFNIKKIRLRRTFNSFLRFSFLKHL